MIWKNPILYTYTDEILRLISLQSRSCGGGYLR